MAQQTFEELVAAVKQAESRGKRYAADGKTLTTSPKGALGEMQVMPKTIKDPGFGVTPAKSSSPDEIARVGVDYLQAMTQKYGDTEKALIAYNWGPGSTDKWIAAGAKPEALPAETRTYVQRVKGFLGKDVSRETMAKKDREPLPESLPPMAKAPESAKTTTVAKATVPKLDMANMPASYKAAFALAALADAQDEEDDRVFNENKGTETEAFFASYKPVNHLASLDLSVAPVMMAEGGEVSEAKDTARKGQAYQELERYLASRGETPSVKIGGYMPGGTNGIFTSDNLNIGSGTIKISKDTAKELVPSVLAHEMTHAADRQMKQQAMEQGMFGRSNQFTEAYEKMVGPEGRNRTLLLRKRYPEFEQDNRYYRSEPKEVAAHGIGAYAGPNIQDRAPRHVDATAATEFRILMDLAQRNVDKGPTGLAKVPAFFRKLGRYADGGAVEPTAEELAAASTPAFIAQKSGIGRKEGNISKALKSGEGFKEAAKGLTMLPQNIVGAPVDLATMAMRPFGYNVEKPVMGSEYLKEKSRAAGLAFKPSDDPALAGFFEAGDLASNLVNPAGATRAGVKAAEKTGEAAKMLARDFQQYNQELAVPGASYAMKPKGGHFYVWPESSAAPEKSQVDAYLQMIENRMDSPNAAVADWVKNKVGRYIRSDFATEQDQMVKAAEEGKKLHFTTPRAMEESAPIIDPSLTIMRKTEGFPPQGLAKTGQGRLVEDIVDSSVWPATLDSTPTDYIPSALRKFKDTDPTMRLYEFPDAVFEDNLKITDLANQMDKMMTEKTVKLWNQEVPIPKEYQLDVDTLKGLTPAQASNRVAMKEEWLAKKEPELAGQALTKDPQLVSHTYDNGSKWISPDDLSENDMHRQMVNSIGCRGGWCTDKDSFALDYGSGDNRLHILLDKGYQPRAQLTMSNRQGTLSEFLAAKAVDDPNYQSDLYENLKNARASGNQQAVYDAVDAFTRLPEYLDWSRKNNIKQISEIKGQFNKEDLTNQPYLKEVQDFVKRQGPELQSVENLDGIGMTDISSHIYPNRAFKAIATPGKKGMKDVYEEAIKINGNSAFIEDDPAIINSVIEKAVNNVFTPKPNAARQIQMNFFEPPAEKAHGGMIERQPTDNRRYL